MVIFVFLSTSSIGLYTLEIKSLFISSNSSLVIFVCKSSPPSTPITVIWTSLFADKTSLYFIAEGLNFSYTFLFSKTGFFPFLVGNSSNFFIINLHKFLSNLFPPNFSS